MTNKKPLVNKRQRFSNWIILVTIAVLLAATYWVVKSNYSPLFPSKKTEKSEQNTSLSIYNLATGQALSGKARSGDMLFFRMSTTYPANIAMLEINEAQKVTIIFQDSRIPPGKDRLIEVADEKFIYTNLDERPKRLCLVAAPSVGELGLLLDQAVRGNAERLAQCVMID